MVLLHWPWCTLYPWIEIPVTRREVATATFIWNIKWEMRSLGACATSYALFEIVYERYEWIKTLNLLVSRHSFAHIPFLIFVYEAVTQLSVQEIVFQSQLSQNRNRRTLEQRLQTSPAIAPHFGVALGMESKDKPKENFTSPMLSEKDRTDTWSRN